MKILVTGSNGSLAQTICPLLRAQGHWVLEYDLPEGNVLDFHALNRFSPRADACIHLAGLKYAGRGELDPLDTVKVNVQGTGNVAEAFGPRMILASTCKAADPETVYGCSKLIAERVTLGVGGRVVRLVNVLGSAGSVIDIWNSVPPTQPLPVCEASRLFITPDCAASLLVRALDWPTGRYGPANPKEQWMTDVATGLYPERKQVQIPLRRGDRRQERLLAACERWQAFEPGVVRIVGQHDSGEEEQVANVYAADFRR